AGVARAGPIRPCGWVRERGPIRRDALRRSGAGGGRIAVAPEGLPPPPTRPRPPRPGALRRRDELDPRPAPARPDRVPHTLHHPRNRVVVAGLRPPQLGPRAGRRRRSPRRRPPPRRLPEGGGRQGRGDGLPAQRREPHEPPDPDLVPPLARRASP